MRVTPGKGECLQVYLSPWNPQRMGIQMSYHSRKHLSAHTLPSTPNTHTLSPESKVGLLPQSCWGTAQWLIKNRRGYSLPQLQRHHSDGDTRKETQSLMLAVRCGSPATHIGERALVSALQLNSHLPYLLWWPVSSSIKFGRNPCLAGLGTDVYLVALNFLPFLAQNVKVGNNLLNIINLRFPLWFIIRKRRRERERESGYKWLKGSWVW